MARSGGLGDAEPDPAGELRSPPSPYISPAGLAKIAIDSAGMVNAMRIIVQPRPASPR